MSSADEAFEKIQTNLDKIKKVFLAPNYEDRIDGWIVEDYLHSIQRVINDYSSKQFKQSETDSVA